MRYLIPIASPSDMFPRSEYHYPKPLIEVCGVPMISLVIENIRKFDAEAEFVFVVHKEDCDSFSLRQVLELSSEGRCKIVALEHPTMGAACSALMAVDHIDDDEPLVVCNGDQVIDADIRAITNRFLREEVDAGVITFPAVHPRWSYVRTSADGDVVESAEKRVLSRSAIAGFYFFLRGSAFVAAAKQSIRNGAAVNGSYFVAPTLNEIVLDGGRVTSVSISEAQYHSFYSPQRIEYFQQHLGERSASAIPPALQILIPMAGLGSRFSEAGFTTPKPFIDVDGCTMIERVMENLHIEGARYILIARNEHLESEHKAVTSIMARGNAQFETIDFDTEGAACTVLTARASLDPSAPLLLANCDQIIDFDFADYILDAEKRGLDGSILCFRDIKRDPKWSFARVDSSGLVQEVREKKAISDLATVGLYWFRRADIFTSAALDMICRNERVNNEFYVCPVYNYAIKQGLRIGVYEISPESMHGIGTPEDLDSYKQHIGLKT